MTRNVIYIVKRVRTTGIKSQPVTQFTPDDMTRFLNLTVAKLRKAYPVAFNFTPILVNIN